MTVTLNSLSDELLISVSFSSLFFLRLFLVLLFGKYSLVFSFCLTLCVCFCLLCVSSISPDLERVALKDDAVKVLHSICQQIWKTQQSPQHWKRSVFIPIPKNGNPKECSNCRTIALISHASKVMLKILRARLQQYVNRELQMFKLVLEKAEEQQIKLSISAGSSRKQESSRKTSISALLTMPKPSTVMITIDCGKF